MEPSKCSLLTGSARFMLSPSLTAALQSRHSRVHTTEQMQPCTYKADAAFLQEGISSDHHPVLLLHYKANAAFLQAAQGSGHHQASYCTTAQMRHILGNPKCLTPVAHWYSTVTVAARVASGRSCLWVNLPDVTIPLCISNVPFGQVDAALNRLSEIETAYKVASNHERELQEEYNRTLNTLDRHRVQQYLTLPYAPETHGTSKDTRCIEPCSCGCNIPRFACGRTPPPWH
eukprot:1160001-Pelagomonas_calceolata.AAC.11